MLKKIKNILKYRKSVSDNISYPNFCLEASSNDEVFSTFRSNKIYQNILEHVSESLAINYFQIIKKDFGLSDSEIYSKVEKFNSIGKPNLIKVSETIPELSGTALRYLHTSLEINKFLEKNEVIPKKIVELGCGYGGQSIFLNEIFKIEDYTYIDLPEVNKLIMKFLSYFKLDFSKNYKTLDTNDFSEYDLFISNYSFSELPRHLQNKAIKKVINNSKCGYMIINSENFSNAYKFMERKDYEKLFKSYEINEERPQTSIKNVNYVFTFNNSNN